jgi:hypothetical protein
MSDLSLHSGPKRTLIRSLSPSWGRRFEMPPLLHRRISGALGALGILDAVSPIHFRVLAPDCGEVRQGFLVRAVRGDHRVRFLVHGRPRQSPKKLSRARRSPRLVFARYRPCFPWGFWPLAR